MDECGCESNGEYFNGSDEFARAGAGDGGRCSVASEEKSKREKADELLERGHISYCKRERRCVRECESSGSVIEESPAREWMRNLTCILRRIYRLLSSG